jgi:hypothetical protein
MACRAIREQRPSVDADEREELHIGTKLVTAIAVSRGCHEGIAATSSSHSFLKGNPIDS